MNREDIESVETGAGYSYWPDDHAWIRSVDVGFNFENIDVLSTGELESRQVFVELFDIETHSGDGFGLQYVRNREVLFEDFEIVDGIVIPAGDYEFGAFGIELGGASERALAPDLELEAGEFFGGEIVSIEAGIEWRPNNRLFLGLEYEYNDIELPAGDFITRLIQVRANFAFNVNWSWVNLIQYDNESSEAGINSRLRWNPRAGQDFYLVVNHGFDAERTFRGLTSTQNQVSLKYTHTFRF